MDRTQQSARPATAPMLATNEYLRDALAAISQKMRALHFDRSGSEKGCSLGRAGEEARVAGWRVPPQLLGGAKQSNEKQADERLLEAGQAKRANPPAVLRPAEFYR